MAHDMHGRRARPPNERSHGRQQPPSLRDGPQEELKHARFGSVAVAWVEPAMLDLKRSRGASHALFLNGDPGRRNRYLLAGN